MTDNKFSVQEDNFLIDLIVNNRPLYDPQHESYKNLSFRDNTWSDIALKLNKSDVDCKKRWKHIRDSYNRCKRKRKWNASDPKSKNSKWKFFERLTFLEQFPLERNAVSLNTNSDFISAPVSQPSTSALEEQVKFIENSQPSSDIPPPANIRLAYTSKDHDEVLQLMKDREEKLHKLTQELNEMRSKQIDDEDTTFSNHVRSVLRKFSARLKIQAKNEIFATLSKYETLHLDTYEGSSTTSLSPTNTFPEILQANFPRQQVPLTYLKEEHFYEEYDTDILSNES